MKKFSSWFAIIIKLAGSSLNLCNRSIQGIDVEEEKTFEHGAVHVFIGQTNQIPHSFRLICPMASTLFHTPSIPLIYLQKKNREEHH